MIRKRSVNKTLYVLPVLFVLSLALLSSCTDDTVCDPTSQPSLKFSFHGHKRYARTPSNGYIDSALSLIVYSVKILGVSDDSLAYVVNTDAITDTVRRTGLSLPVSTINGTTSYEINMYAKGSGIGSQTIADTLSISYAKKLVFISQGCGYGYNYTLDKKAVHITNHFFNSIQTPLSNPLISTDVPENFQVIYNNN